MDNPTPNLPQPIDYGLTYKETFNGLYVGGERKFRDELRPHGYGRQESYKQNEQRQPVKSHGVLLRFDST